MAVAIEALRGAAARLPSGGQQGGTGTGIKLIWAAAAGLLALEVLSLATGRYWTWSLKGGLTSLQQAGTYIGLYPGQPSVQQATPTTSAQQQETAIANYYQLLGQQLIAANQGIPPAQRGRSAGTQGP